MLVGIIIGAVVLLLIIFVISSYNKLVKQKVNVEEAFATMDVYLKKRFDFQVRTLCFCGHWSPA